MVDVNGLVDQTEGKVITVTGPDGGQCTAIPHYWQRMLGLPIVYGNAKDTFANATDRLYVKTLNSTDNFPRAGAIVVWNDNWGAGYGHTGVATWNCDSNTLYVLEQNDGDGGVTHVGKHDYTDVIGWFYPRVLDQPAPAPVTVVPPAPQPAAVPAPSPLPVPLPVSTPVPQPSVSDSSVSANTPPSAPSTAPSFNSDNETREKSSPSASSGVKDVQTTTPDNSSTKSGTFSPQLNPVPVAAPTVVPTNTAPAPKMPPKEDLLMQITKRMHDVLMVAAATFAVGGALVNYLNSVESVSLLGLIVAIAGALEHARITNP